ncbi:MAG: hypothetical protein IKU14_06150 [Rhodocyclaceae bacterium]|nr:hypothetical protein [Rhodocyclaceae bacterium]
MTAPATDPAIDRPLPKSYLNDAESAQRLAEGSTENAMFLAESRAAGRAGDEDASWAWLARAEMPAHTLRFLKHRRGAEFIREMGFDTTLADQEFGEGWLDKEDPLFKRWA